MNDVDVGFNMPNELKHRSVINTISSPILGIKILIRENFQRLGFTDLKKEYSNKRC